MSHASLNLMLLPFNILMPIYGDKQTMKHLWMIKNPAYILTWIFFTAAEFVTEYRASVFTHVLEENDADTSGLGTSRYFFWFTRAAHRGQRLAACQCLWSCVRIICIIGKISCTQITNLPLVTNALITN